METSWSVLLWRPYTRLGLGEPISKAQPHRIQGNPGGGRRYVSMRTLFRAPPSTSVDAPRSHPHDPTDR